MFSAATTNGLPFSFVRDRAPEIHNALSRHDIDHGDRRPYLLFQLGQKPLASGRIVAGGRRALGREACEGVKRTISSGVDQLIRSCLGPIKMNTGPTG